MKDRLRQFANVACAVAQVVLSVLAGAGLLGGRTTGEIAGQYPTPVGPAGYAFAIWGPIFLWCLAYAAYQALPAQRENPLLRRVGLYTASAFAGNALWLIALQTERFLLAWALILSILLSLAAAFAGILRLGRPLTEAERWLVEAPLGVLFGWITVANVANAAQVLVAYAGRNVFGLAEVQWSVTLLLLGGLFAVLVTLASGSAAYALAVLWALLAVLVNGLETSATVASVAGTLAVIVVLALATARTVFRSRRRRERTPA